MPLTVIMIWHQLNNKEYSYHGYQFGQLLLVGQAGKATVQLLHYLRFVEPHQLVQLIIVGLLHLLQQCLLLLMPLERVFHQNLLLPQASLLHYLPQALFRPYIFLLSPYVFLLSPSIFLLSPYIFLLSPFIFLLSPDLLVLGPDFLVLGHSLTLASLRGCPLYLLLERLIERDVSLPALLVLLGECGFDFQILRGDPDDLEAAFGSEAPLRLKLTLREAPGPRLPGRRQSLAAAGFLSVQRLFQFLCGPPLKQIYASIFLLRQRPFLFLEELEPGNAVLLEFWLLAGCCLRTAFFVAAAPRWVLTYERSEKFGAAIVAVVVVFEAQRLGLYKSERTSAVFRMTFRGLLETGHAHQCGIIFYTVSTVRSPQRTDAAEQQINSLNI